MWVCNTRARRLRFHCCICSFGIGHEALSPAEFPSVPLMDSAFVRSSSSNNIDEYLFSRGLHKPKSESFKWPFLSSIRLSGFMSLKAKKILNQRHVGGWLWSDLYTVCTCKRTDSKQKTVAPNCKIKTSKSNMINVCSIIDSSNETPKENEDRTKGLKGNLRETKQLATIRVQANNYIC